MDLMLTDKDLERLKDRYYEHPSRVEWAEIVGRQHATVLDHYDDAPAIVAHLLPELEALRELLRAFANDEPLHGSEYDGDTLCLYCAYQDPGHYDREAQRWIHDRTVLERHGPDCLWRRACELLGIVPQDPEPMQTTRPSAASAPAVQPLLVQAWQEQLRQALAISPAEMRRRELWQELPLESEQ